MQCRRIALLGASGPSSYVRRAAECGISLIVPLSQNPHTQRSNYLGNDVSMTLQELAKKMQAIDFSMLFTRTKSGAMAGRPMSNNGDVEYDGDNYFFAFDSATMVQDIERDPAVALSLAGPKGLLGKPGIFIAVEGKADLIRDKAAFAAHWQKDLDRWFKQGIDTPGIVLIKVQAERVAYWDGEDSGEIPV
jgi:general stress protein 26